MGVTQPPDRPQAHADHVRRVFADDGLAARYGRERFPARRHARELRTLRRLLPALGAGPRLDLACGAGRFGAALGEGDKTSGARHPVTGADASEAMLREAAATGAYADLVLADARRLPFGDGAFAGAICIRLLQHLDTADRRAVLGEVRRTVRGAAVVSFFDAGTLEAMRARLLRRGAAVRSRRAITVAEFEGDLAATGWRLARLGRKLGRFTEHVFALLAPVAVPAADAADHAR